MTDREQGMLDIVMHNVLIFVLVNPPLSACERRSCCSRLSYQRSYSYAKIFVSARSLRDLNEVTPPGGRRSRKQ